MIELFQKFPEPGGILPDDVDKEYSADRKKKNGQVQQKNNSANQDPLFLTHNCLHKANRLPEGRTQGFRGRINGSQRS